MCTSKYQNPITMVYAIIPIYINASVSGCYIQLVFFIK
ncbi:hypothetical protein P9112_013293 [Eukaryota sp. TZLM1-RC]